MSDWWSYRPEDFLLFGPQVYWRLFQLANQAAWPLQVATTLFGLALLALLARPGGLSLPWTHRVAAGGLAALWIHTGWAFLLHRYVPVNWAAGYAVPLFALQAALLLGLAAVPGRLRVPAVWWPRRAVGTVLLAHGVVVHPLLAMAAGRPLRQSEVFGIAPDPTAIGTLGLLVAAVPGWPGALCLVLPLAWCLASAATLLALGGWEGWIPLGAALLALAARLWPVAATPAAGGD
ncbi:MAG: DUF6064 family protein [Sneathiellaceae bacterium]